MTSCAGTVSVCCVCLDTSFKLRRMNQELYEIYLRMLDENVEPERSHVDSSVCYRCACALIRCAKLRRACASAANKLRGLLQHYGQITEESLNVLGPQHFNRLVITRHDNINIQPSDCHVADVTDSFCQVVKKEEEEDVFVDADDVGTDEDTDLATVKLKWKIVDTLQEESKFTETDNDCSTHEDDARPSPQEDNSEGSACESVETKKVKKTRVSWESVEKFAEKIPITREQLELELRSRRDSDKYKQSKYKCEECYTTFINRIAYQNHQVKHMPSSGEHVCPVCKIRKHNKYGLSKHYTSAHGDRYRCRDCGHISMTSTQARQHNRWHKGMRFQCQFCGRTFAHPSTFLSHVRLTHPTQFTCDLCGESFISQFGVQQHKHKSHSRPSTLNTAPGCDGVTLEHGTVDSMKCDKETVLKCTECGIDCPTLTSLAAHTRWKHPLSKHSEKHYKCSRCDLTFKNQKNVRIHERIHSGVRPYVCDVCGKNFVAAISLQLHTRTHTGERPYPCDKCDKCFKVKSALRRHSLTHSGLKPHKCPHCDKCFSQSSGVKLHVHTVHMKLPPPYVSSRKRRRDSVVQN